MRPAASSPRPSRQHGLTLIELVVAIAVLAIMVTWAIPGFQKLTARNQVAAEVMRIKTALAFARNTAISRRRTLTICPTRDQVVCLDNWSLELMAFEDHPPYGSRSTDDPILKHWPKGNTATRFNGFSSNSRLTYRPLGTSYGYNGTVSICGRKDFSAYIIINITGRARISSTSSTSLKC